MELTFPSPPEIPVIDLSGFFSGDAASKQQTADRIRQICEVTGFLIVSGHGIPQRVFDDAFRLSRRFFGLQQSKKDQWHPKGAARQRGYHALATRGLAYTLDQQAPPDLRETLFLGPVDDHRAFFAAYPESETAYAPNIYPDEPAELTGALIAVYRAYEYLAGELFRVFAVALDLPESFFAGKFERHFSILSSHYYPPLVDEPAVGQLRTGAHTDFGAFTILAIADAPGGLEVRLPDNRWSAVKPPPGSLVINLGDMMARWTNDRWASTLHRVVNPPQIRAMGSERQSIGFFAHPNFDAEIACIPSCMDSGTAPIYPAITAGEHIGLKISKSHRSVGSGRA
ncbi:MAG: 2-oxoglutarate and iron-dependent oxygenase domain-containing protein [Pseudomonadota bacterium]|nr:2-oxoglutarate and iron-dependent oxygenase domain-containing protein [Pseudomonadota bacterium]MEE3287902.1 2-oxoglutarate and iron-dependent oxygenase domain-containing protein [Pseudomonadota bacterium]